MPFDRDLATELLKSRDRDTARFFAGRRDEIRAFDDAADEAGQSEQAIFRIYQGAPGCGKTSLAAHLAETRADRLLFVKLRPKDLIDDNAMSVRILGVTAIAALSRMAVSALTRTGQARQAG